MTDEEARRRTRLAQSLLNQRDPSEQLVELAVMALRGADLEQLRAADEQMREGS